MGASAKGCERLGKKAEDTETETISVGPHATRDHHACSKKCIIILTAEI